MKINYFNGKKTTGMQPTEAYHYINRRAALKILCWSGLGTTPLLFACERKVKARDAVTKAADNIGIDPAADHANPHTATPVIDASAPDKIETATFAMG
jgi:hypothetical protein